MGKFTHNNIAYVETHSCSTPDDTHGHKPVEDLIEYIREEQARIGPDEVMFYTYDFDDDRIFFRSARLFTEADRQKEELEQLERNEEDLAGLQRNLENYAGAIKSTMKKIEDIKAQIEAANK